LETLDARLATARGLRWMSEFERGRVLHVFERSANLANQRGEVLSIVDPEIGPGPFTVVLSHSFDFQSNWPQQAEIGMEGGLLRVGAHAIKVSTAEIWDPVPPWRSIGAERLSSLVETIESEMRASPIRPAIVFDPPPDSEDRAALAAFAERLAGLGPGLTPSGDDVLMGLIHAIFVRYPVERAAEASRVVDRAAVGRTTSLSAAWLNAAAAGEAGHLWHRMVRSASAGEDGGLRGAIRTILATGHTSGADALAGFVAGFPEFDGRAQGPPQRVSM
jgi:hypothetical protein